MAPKKKDKKDKGPAEPKVVLPVHVCVRMCANIL